MSGWCLELNLWDVENHLLGFYHERSWLSGNFICELEFVGGANDSLVLAADMLTLLCVGPG